MLGGVLQGFDLLPVPRLQGFAFAPALFLDGVEASLGGCRIHVGASLLFEPAAHLCELVYVLIAETELLVGVPLFEVGDLRLEVFDLTLGLDAGLLFLLQRAGPGGDLLLRSLQRRGGLIQVAPKLGHLLLQVLDQGAGSFHALSERGSLIPGILAHDRLSCVTRDSTLVERVTPGRPGVKSLPSAHCLSGREPPPTLESQGLPERLLNSSLERFAEASTCPFGYKRNQQAEVVLSSCRCRQGTGPRRPSSRW